MNRKGLKKYTNNKIAFSWQELKHDGRSYQTYSRDDIMQITSKDIESNDLDFDFRKEAQEDRDNSFKSSY